MKNPDFVFDVLELLDQNDMCDMVTWTTNRKTKEVQFQVICNDLFFWGSADCEDLTPQNLSLLKQSIIDVNTIKPDYGTIYGISLFCTRIRQQRPQGAAYPENKALWPLFDACGPERKIELGNPYKPGDYP